MSGSNNSGATPRVEKLKAALRTRRAAKKNPLSDTPSVLPSAPSAQTGTAVHLLREDEVVSLARDIVAGLGFLHSKGILHQDVKPANCLLHWSEDALIPRVLLSDFGSSSLLHDNWRRQRSGHTGTMEFMAPEAVRVNARTGMLQELSSKADIWSFGMILHLLIFLRLPYTQVEDVDRLRDEMLAYGGWQDEYVKFFSLQCRFMTQITYDPCCLSLTCSLSLLMMHARLTNISFVLKQKRFYRADSMLSNIHTCQSFIPLLSKLLQMDPVARPSADEILHELRQLSQERGLGLVPPEPYEDSLDKTRGHARKREAHLRRRRRQSASTTASWSDQTRRPRLLDQGVEVRPKQAHRPRQDEQDEEDWLVERPCTPLWMTERFAQRPLVRYQQERMGLLPSPLPAAQPWAQTPLRPLHRANQSARRHAGTILVVGLIYLQRVGLDWWCYPGRIGWRWDYPSLLGALLICMAVILTEEQKVQRLVAGHVSGWIVLFATGLLVTPLLGVLAGSDLCSIPKVGSS